MTTKTLKHVEAECRRFLDRLSELTAIEKGNEQSQQIAKDTGGYAFTQTGTRVHGAARRAAHDLKQALTYITQNRDLS